jgi:hypothetical protein
MRNLPKIMMVIIIATSFSGSSCSGDSTKETIVKMKARRGGVHKADNVSLHFQNASVDCSLNFYSEESGKYIESLGADPIPVVFKVSYDNNGKPTGALLVRIGDWEAKKFRPNERLLATTEQIRPGAPGAVDSPAGCFEPVANR